MEHFVKAWTWPLCPWRQQRETLLNVVASEMETLDFAYFIPTDSASIVHWALRWSLVKLWLNRWAERNDRTPEMIWNTGCLSFFLFLSFSFHLCFYKAEEPRLWKATWERGMVSASQWNSWDRSVNGKGASKLLASFWEPGRMAELGCTDEEMRKEEEKKERSWGGVRWELNAGFIVFLLLDVEFIIGRWISYSYRLWHFLLLISTQLGFSLFPTGK